jgi:RNA polymerase sigma factor (sigma-70 family)
VRAESRESWLLDRVREAQRGDTSAFEGLVRQYGPRLHRFALAMLRDEDAARDVVQETLLVAWRDLPRLRRAERFWSWLGGIALRQARSASRPPTHVLSTQVVEPMAAEEVSSTELRSALDSLDEAHREVLLMRYLLGFSEREAADALGVRVGTVKSRTARARDRLAISMGRARGER